RNGFASSHRGKLRDPVIRLDAVARRGCVPHLRTGSFGLAHSSAATFLQSREQFTLATSTCRHDLVGCHCRQSRCRRETVWPIADAKLKTVLHHPEGDFLALS